MSSIELRAVEKWFGDLQVIRGVDMEVQQGEFIVFVGPSGCGKSTLLRLIGGLEEATVGSILIDGTDVTGKPPAQRGLAMVFQSYALYPHMSVGENMGFSLKVAGIPREEISEKVGEAARILKLEALLNRRPKELSGGQRQRVAIGRSIVRNPAAFLFDEPLSNLDAALRVEMRYEIAKLHQTLKASMIYVTHDQVEAMTLADRIVVLEQGQIAQIGTPRELYERPGNLFVAQFIGSPRMNIVPTRTEDGSYFLAGEKSGSYRGDRPADRLGVRPEHIELGPPGGGHIDGTVDVREYLGADTFVIVDCGALGKVTARTSGESVLRPGEPVSLHLAPGKLHFIDPDGQAIRQKDG